MVCLGNICRSPLADGLLRAKVEEAGLSVDVDSAGTSGLHAGEAPDTRMRETARKFGYSIDALKSRQFTVDDFDTFDLIYVMDGSNYTNILSLARNKGDEDKVTLILDELHPGERMEVPDPYFGGDQGFIHVYELLNEATDRIINKLKSNG